jgi:membrane associated rhomboid family serine protease
MLPFPRGQRPLRETAPVTFWLIVANLLVSLWTWLVVDPESLLVRWGLVPERLLSHAGPAEWLTLVTSMFLHGGLLHLAFNAMMLYFLGRLVEPTLGSRRLGLLYFATGAAAGLAQVALDPASAIPMVGASGAISGLLGAALVLAPRTRVSVMTPFTLFIPITMRLATFGWIWVALQVVALAFVDPFGGGVAYMAHLGGFVAGYLGLLAYGALRKARQQAVRAAYAARVGHGPAPSPRFRTFYVTDGYGRTFAFHEPVR